MSKLILTTTIVTTAVFLMMVFVAKPVNAQNATDSGTATDSATASDSATATDSGVSTGSATATDSSTPAVLPESGAHDVLIMFSAGLVFLLAGITVLSGTRQVFNDFE